MSDATDSFYPPDWVKYARKDWRRIRLLLNDDDSEGAAFFLQQAVEKYLKAFLLQSGWRLKRIHDLDALLDDVVKYNPALEAFRPSCKRISGYYLIERYPLPVPSGLSRKDVEKDMEEARTLIKTMFPDEKV
jgi:HEPN domain-containing protein